MNIYTCAITGIFGSLLLSTGLFILIVKRRMNTLQQRYDAKKTETNRQKELFHTIIFSQENEHKRIGADLHTNVASVLASLRFTIEHFANTAQADATQLLRCKSIIDQAINNVRKVSYQLSPFIKGYTLADAISDYCDGINYSGRMSISFEFTPGIEKARLDEPTSLIVYRIVTEVVNNSIQVGSPGRMSLKFSFHGVIYSITFSDDRADASVTGREDNRRLFRSTESMLELIGGRYRISSAEQKGLRINISFPVCNSQYI
jgi:signal transduction histidine kinase